MHENFQIWAKTAKNGSKTAENYEPAIFLTLLHRYFSWAVRAFARCSTRFCTIFTSLKETRLVTLKIACIFLPIIG